MPGSESKTHHVHSFVIDGRVHDEQAVLGGDLRWAYGLNLSYLSEHVASFNTTSYPYRCDDAKRVVHWFDEDKGRISQNIDRFAWLASFEDFDLSLGRQAFAYGVARIANPTDVFAPFPLQRIDQEFRLGVDGARLTVPLGELSEWELSYIIGKNAKAEESAALVRFKTQIVSTDSELIIINFRKAHLLGFNFEGSMWDIGVRVEGATVKPIEGKAYQRWVLGGAYMFDEGSVFDLEYYYNQSGGQNRFAYPGLWQSFAYTKGGVFFQGQHYLSTSYNRSLSPLLQSVFQLVANLSDGTMLTVAQINYNSTDNTYLDLGCFISPPHKSENKAFQGEFASLGQQVFASARYYW